MNNLEITQNDKIITIALNRPDFHNAFNDEMIEELRIAFENISLESNHRVVILKGNGKSFSAGADINYMKAAAGYSKSENMLAAEKMAKMFKAINNCPLPVICHAHGSIMGGGIGLVACCDYVICAPNTIFSFSEVKLGIIPAVISPFAIQKIGISNSRSLMLSGERFSAQTAQNIGLVHDICDDFADKTNEKIASYLAASPNAISSMKLLLDKISTAPINDDTLQICAEGIANARASNDGKEGIMAFLEKQKPKWVTTNV